MNPEMIIDTACLKMSFVECPIVVSDFSHRLGEWGFGVLLFPAILSAVSFTKNVYDDDDEERVQVNGPFKELWSEEKWAYAVPLWCVNIQWPIVVAVVGEQCIVWVFHSDCQYPTDKCNHTTLLFFFPYGRGTVQSGNFLKLLQQMTMWLDLLIQWMFVKL